MKRQAYGYRNLEFYKLKLLTLHQTDVALVG
jgi:transposase